MKSLFCFSADEIELFLRLTGIFIALTLYAWPHALGHFDFPKLRPPVNTWLHEDGFSELEVLPVAQNCELLFRPKWHLISLQDTWRILVWGQGNSHCVLSCQDGQNSAFSLSYIYYHPLLNTWDSPTRKMHFFTCGDNFWNTEWCLYDLSMSCIELHSSL